MTSQQSPGGKARAATATRGRAGQFVASNNPASSIQHDPSSSKYVKVTLKSLHLHTEWWESLQSQYPNVNLHAELLKALDWHRADRVKSPKLFFRNWIERASLSAPAIERTPEQIRASLRVVS